MDIKTVPTDRCYGQKVTPTTLHCTSCIVKSSIVVNKHQLNFIRVSFFNIAKKKKKKSYLALVTDYYRTASVDNITLLERRHFLVFLYFTHNLHNCCRPMEGGTFWRINCPFSSSSSRSQTLWFEHDAKGVRRDALSPLGPLWSARLITIITHNTVISPSHNLPPRSDRPAARALCFHSKKNKILADGFHAVQGLRGCWRRWAIRSSN